MTDHFVANFSGGASSLVAYTPDVGAALSSPSGQSNVFTWNWGDTPIFEVGFNPMQKVWFKDAAGYFFFEQANPPNSWGGNGYVQINTPAVTPDYYVEALWEFAGTPTDMSWVSSVAVRVDPATNPDTAYDVGGVIFKANVDRGYPTSSDLRVVIGFDCGLTDPAWAAGGGCSITSYVGTSPLLLSNSLTTLKVRLEVEGFNLRGFINDVLVMTGVFAETTTTTLSTSKKAFVQFWPFGTDAEVRACRIDYMKAGDAFLPPPAGDFWQDFVKTVEA